MAGKITFFATAGANKIIATGPAILERIIVGKDVASSIIEVSNDPGDGDADVQIYIEGNTLLTTSDGSIEVNAEFTKGIAADLTNQTHVGFVWRPLNL
jgi:hypothetical protein